MNDILNTILQNTYTQTQLKHRVRLLKSYIEKTLFTTDGNLKDASLADINWLRSLPDAFYKNFNRENIYQKFSEIEPEIEKLSALTLYLSFEPNDEAISYIGELVRKTFANAGLLIDIKIDPLLIAGCALSFKGVYKDYSLRAKIEEKKAQIMENFKQFLR